MEIVRRACREVTATPFTDSPVHLKQLSYGSPHTGLESNLQLPAFGEQKSSDHGRSTVVRHSTEFPPTRTSVRWRSPSDDKEQFFDSLTSAVRTTRGTINASETKESAEMTIGITMT